MDKTTSIDELIKILKQKLRHARNHVENGYKMEQNLTKHGGWTVGYWKARVFAYEELLDIIYKGDDWENNNEN